MEFQREDAERLLSAAIDIGEGILCSGGEVQRVESTVTLIMTACGAERVDAFVITSAIFVTVRAPRWGVLTQSRRVGPQHTDLKRLSMYNQLSREICARPFTPEEISSRVAAIRGGGEPGGLRLTLDWALAGAAFCLFFGGGPWEALVSGVMCMLLHLVRSSLKKIRLNDYYAVILSSALGGGLLLIPEQAGLSASTIAMGCIMLFVPGIAITNSIRDIFSGDLISGLLRFCESMLLSFVIAFGFAFAATGGDTVADVPVFVALTAAFMGALSFARLFNLDRGDSLIGGFMGLLGWAAVLLGWEMGLSTFFAFFIGSAAVTMASEILARVRRCPVTVFLVTSIIPMVPGGLLYMTMRAAVARTWSLFLGRGLEATMTAAAIAAGIIAVTALADVYYGIRRSPRRS